MELVISESKPFVNKSRDVASTIPRGKLISLCSLTTNCTLLTTQTPGSMCSVSLRMAVWEHRPRPAHSDQVSNLEKAPPGRGLPSHFSPATCLDSPTASIMKRSDFSPRDGSSGCLVFVCFLYLSEMLPPQPDTLVQQHRYRFLQHRESWGTGFTHLNTSQVWPFTVPP